MSTQTKIILGPPGTGKTTRLLDVMEKELEHVSPYRISYVSFTKKAVTEALNRAINKFELTKNNLPYFRTLHSLAYRVSGLMRQDVMGKKDWDEFGNLLNIKFTKHLKIEEGFPYGGRSVGDTMRYMCDYANATFGDPLKLFARLEVHDVNLYLLKRFIESLRAYKNDTGMMDFDDMLNAAFTQPPIDVDVAIIDEAQDLSPKQWELVAHLFSNVERLYIAGDDEQSLFSFAGADVKQFLALKGDFEVLHQSYRVPIAIQEVAQKISSRIKSRYPKQWGARDEQGLVKFHQYMDRVELNNGKSWFLLARNQYMLKDLRETAMHQGVLFSIMDQTSSVKPQHVSAINAYEQLRRGQQITTSQLKDIYAYAPPQLTPPSFKNQKKLWSLDNEDIGFRGTYDWDEFFIKIKLGTIRYYKKILKNGIDLKEKPKIHISTIHSVKGGEADCVMLLNDVSHRAYSKAIRFREAADDEHRVFYVGVTRAREELHRIYPRSSNSYDHL